jgi:hypothetical protein
MREEISLLLTKQMNGNKWLRSIQKLLKMAEHDELSPEERKVLDKLMEESNDRRNEWLKQLDDIMNK